MLILMFQDAFIKLDKNKCDELLAEVNPALNGSPFDPLTATILSQEPSFYPGYTFLDIADYGVTPSLRKYALYKPGDVIVLDGTNKPVYALNDKVPLGLTDDTVFDYVRFFFNYVRGPHGRFTIAENVDDIAWREEPPPVARKAMGKMLRPLALAGKKDDGRYHLNACIVFGDALYKTDILVSRNGRVTTSAEEILADELPLLDDVLGQ